MEGRAINIAKNSNTCDAQVAASAYDAYRDLSPVSDEKPIDDRHVFSSCDSVAECLGGTISVPQYNGVIQTDRTTFEQG